MTLPGSRIKYGPGMNNNNGSVNVNNNNNENNNLNNNTNGNGNNNNTPVELPVVVACGNDPLPSGADPCLVEPMQFMRFGGMDGNLLGVNCVWR